MSEQPNDAQPREIRRVEVNDPNLSAHTNKLLTDELREVVGESYVEVPADRPHVSGGVGAGAPRPGSRTAFNFIDNRMMIGTIGFMLIALVLIRLLFTGDWWVLPVAFIGLLLLAWAVIRIVLSMTSTREHLAPTTAAAVQEEGVANPDELFSAAVEEFTQDRPSESDEHRTTSVQDDPARAGAEQQRSTTPTSGRSRAVGP